MHQVSRSRARCPRTRRSRRPGSRAGPTRRAVGRSCRRPRRAPPRWRRHRRVGEALVVAPHAGDVDEPGFAHHAVVGDAAEPTDGSSDLYDIHAAVLRARDGTDPDAVLACPDPSGAPAVPRHHAVVADLSRLAPDTAVHRGRHDGDLLPRGMQRATTRAQHASLCLRRRRGSGRVPAVPPLPARSFARDARLARHLQRRLTRPASDFRRRAR